MTDRLKEATDLLDKLDPKERTELASALILSEREKSLREAPALAAQLTTMLKLAGRPYLVDLAERIEMGLKSPRPIVRQPTIPPHPSMPPPPRKINT